MRDVRSGGRDVRRLQGASTWSPKRPQLEQRPRYEIRRISAGRFMGERKISKGWEDVEGTLGEVDSKRVAGFMDEFPSEL